MTSKRRPKYNAGTLIEGTPYAVVRFIGQGAMGAAYEVTRNGLARSFVMKVLHEDLGGLEEPVRRIERECHLLAKIDHPNVVSVVDAGSTSSGLPYFVMPRLEGSTLTTLMRQRSRWHVDEVLQLAIGMFDGLAAVHTKQIVHRDIKPSNVFVTEGLFAKLLDFGIAKSKGVENWATAKGMMLGTPRYMSPEQAQGGAVDYRTDLYSAGIVLYELLAGAHPFAHAATPVEMLIAQATWTPAPIRVDNPRSASAIADIVARLLLKQPDARPASAHVVRDWLMRIQRESLALPSRLPAATGPSTLCCRIDSSALVERRRAKAVAAGLLSTFLLVWGYAPHDARFRLHSMACPRAPLWVNSRVEHLRPAAVSGSDRARLPGGRDSEARLPAGRLRNESPASSAPRPVGPTRPKTRVQRTNSLDLDTLTRR